MYEYLMVPWAVRIRFAGPLEGISNGYDMKLKPRSYYCTAILFGKYTKWLADILKLRHDDGSLVRWLSLTVPRPTQTGML